MFSSNLQSLRYGRAAQGRGREEAYRVVFGNEFYVLCASPLGRSWRMPVSRAAVVSPLQRTRRWPGSACERSGVERRSPTPARPA